MGKSKEIWGKIGKVNLADFEISCLFDEAENEDVPILLPYLREFLKHSYWGIRCDALELIGYYELAEFLPEVKDALEDRIVNVRIYALNAYYEILREEALPIVKKACQVKHVKERIKALALCFIETEEQEYFDQICRILCRKNCNYLNFYVVYHNFENYLQTNTFPEIMELYRKLIPIFHTNPGIVTTLTERLKSQ